MKVNKKMWGLLAIAFLSLVIPLKSSDEGSAATGSEKFFPAIYEDIVVWEDTRNGNADIYGCRLPEPKENIAEYSLSSLDVLSFPITKDQKDQLAPAIHGGIVHEDIVSRDIVVWQDNRHGNWDIYGCILQFENNSNGPSLVDFRITTHTADQLAPAIYYKTVVWQDNRHGNWDIYGCTLQFKDNSNDPLLQEFRITTHSADQLAPAIFGTIVVWADSRNGNWDIYGYDISNSEEFQITKDPNSQRFPAIHGNTVVWMDWRNQNWDIFYCNLSDKEEVRKELPITVNPNDQRSPEIFGGIVVWHDNRNWYNGERFDWDIYCYYLSEKEVHVTANAANQRFPRIYGDLMVWMDFRECSWGIYYSKLPPKPPESPRLLTSSASCPKRRCQYLAYGGVPLVLVILIFCVLTVARKYQEQTKSRSFKVNAFKDPLSRFLLTNWQVFFGILFLFSVSCILPSLFYGTLGEIDINHLPREKMVLLNEEACFRSILEDPVFVLCFIIPALIFYPATRFFRCIPRKFKELLDDKIIKKRKFSERKVEDDFKESLQELEKLINGNLMYVPGFLIAAFGYYLYFREVQYQRFQVILWNNFDVFPLSSLMFAVVELSIFFVFGIFLWKMGAAIYFTMKLNKDYELEYLATVKFFQETLFKRKKGGKEYMIP